MGAGLLVYMCLRLGSSGCVVCLGMCLCGESAPPQLRASTQKLLGHLTWVGEFNWPFNISKFKWLCRDQLLSVVTVAMALPFLFMGFVGRRLAAST